MFFTHVIKKIYQKWLVNNYIIKSYIDLVGFLVVNFKTVIVNHLIKNYYKANNLNKNYIKEISKNIIYN